MLPLFRQLGFHRITAAGHKDKALEYGKDVWMKYTLPTLHVLYFGIQAKKGKLDAAGASKDGSSNVAEIHNQVTMMLGHEISIPSTSRRVLVDHAFIVAGGEITKQARNWLWKQAGREQALADDVHGPRRHSQPVHRDEFAITEGHATCHQFCGRL